MTDGNLHDRADYSGPFDPDFRYEDLSKEALVRLVREYALTVHLLDRSMCAAIGMKYGQEVVEELAIEEWRGASPDLRRPPPPDHGHRGRRRRGDLQGAAARSRVPAALHGRALRDRRRAPRVLRAHVLRGAHGRRAVGRAGHHRHVPHDRGRHLRSHRAGREPEGARHPRPPSAPRAGRARAALPLGDHDRRRQRDAGGAADHDHDPRNDRGDLPVPADARRHAPPAALGDRRSGSGSNAV